MKIDTILTDYDPPEVLVKYAPTSFVCFNKEDLVVRLQDCGRADVNGLWSVATMSEWQKFCALLVERDIEMVIKRGGNLGKPIYAAIDDFENLTYAKAVNIKSIQNIVFLLKGFADNYPETLKSITIINAPSYFAWLYATLRPIFPSSITDKIRVFGTDGWKEVLLEEINSEVLPAYLGGSRTDPDGNPFCESIIIRGQLIPKRYYLQNRKKKLSLETNVKKLTVKPFSKEEICFEVKEENSYLEWEFQTKSRDIEFALLFRRETSEGSETEELIPKQRIDAGYEPEKGIFKCEKIGNYSIVFDNSKSWIYLKEVYYRAGVLSAKDYDFNTQCKTSFS